MATAEPQPSGPPTTLRRRVLAVLAVVLLIAAAWTWIRGSWAETVERNPTRADEGCLVQLLRTADGRVVVRAGEVLPYPADRLWSAVTDYEHFTEIFATLWWRYAEVTASPEKDGVRHLLGKVDSAVGRWPVDIDIRHRVDPAERRADWDGSEAELPVNRGHWLVRPAGEQAGLLVLEVEVKVRRCPDVLVNNVLLSHLGSAIAAVREHLARAR